MEQAQTSGGTQGNRSPSSGAAKGGKSMVLWVAVLVVIIAIGGYLFSARASKPDISGSWQSKAAEDIGSGSFATRQFLMTADSWSLDFTAYGDKGETYPLFKFHSEGPYTIDDSSKTVPGAYNAVFKFGKKEVTLLAPDPAVSKKLGFDSCGLTAGAQKDISATGCSFLPSVSVCGQEYDLVKRDGDTLQLGARPADNNLCTVDKRPTALGYQLGR